MDCAPGNFRISRERGEESVLRGLIFDRIIPFSLKEYGVQKIGLFGSYAKSRAHESSDVDLVIEFEHPIGFRFVDLAEYLEKVLGLKVD